MKRAKQTSQKVGNFPVLGCGVGLRPPHYQHILEEIPKSIDWFEAVSENYLDTQGRPVRVLEEVRKHYPVGLHGVSLSVGSADPLNLDYLDKLKALIGHIEPALVSDHLCWASINHEELHDLLPLPFSEEALKYLISRVDQVQSHLKTRILIENVSSYVTYAHSTIPEYEFITQLAKQSGCGILLDVNNIFVNAKNHAFDPITYLDHVPAEYVGQFHVAGHMDRGKFLFDTHEGPIVPEVWRIYEEAMRRYGQVSTLIEWDTKIPEFAVLEEENNRARAIYNQFQISQAPKEEAAPHLRKSQPLDAQFQNELKTLQTEFKKEIYKVQDHVIEPHTQAYFNPQAGDPGAERLNVYAEGHHALTEEALSGVFEAVKHLVGEGAFAKLIYDYIKGSPSHHYNLNFRGEKLPDFLTTHPTGKELPFLSDLAKFEWLKNLAYHEELKECINPDELAGVPPEKWEHASIGFQPSVFVISSDWPIYDLWEARKIETSAIDIQVEGRPQSILIYRENLDVKAELIDRTQATFLQALLNRNELGEACELLVSNASTELPPVMQWFTQWVQQRMVTQINLKQKTVG